MERASPARRLATSIPAARILGANPLKVDHCEFVNIHNNLARVNVEEGPQEGRTVAPARGSLQENNLHQQHNQGHL